MEKIKWNTELETGIIDIDIQHRTLFNLGKILIDALDNGREDEVIDGIIIELNRYTVYHAKTEEEYHIGGADDLKEHRRLHKEFIENVSNFGTLYKEMGGLDFSKFILDFIIDWIEDHIKGIDMRDLPKK